MELVILIAVWFLFFILTFRSPGAPKVIRLLFFVLLMAMSAVLGYVFLVRVLDWNPNPTKVNIANYLTENRMIDLQQIAAGVPDLDYIHRVDTDGDTEANIGQDPLAGKEWLVFYQYNIVGGDSQRPQGPFGAAIYDPDHCRPRAIRSHELIPTSYDYLGVNWADIYAIDNIIPYQDPLSKGLDRPEVVISGGAASPIQDLNVFRKVGTEPTCLERQDWLRSHPGQVFPAAWQVRYENIGSFRGSYKVKMEGSTVTVWDSGGFERNQFTIRKMYRPENGSYFQPGTQVLLPPVEYSVDFGPGQPDDVPNVYYPEKAVLAFYLNLTKDDQQLAKAKTWLSPAAQQIYNMKTDPFGLSTDPDSVATARKELARVLVWEIRYEPDVQAEILHQDQEVVAVVTGVNDKGAIDYDHPCQVAWTVVAVENPQALPYGCEWGLESYWTTCVPTGQGK